ncbi:hypothetical protein F6X40_35570 [Paraburkholderia sp. UCT31]|uniref:hypothetical protein n=1 Tax=Paraburkholderia sp. UCT31 TaxID=2615209 RepID=UPI001655AA80|nr:hypothetical protein [Paraburkholderia sp. UCT31]MBC8741870.1 hypothetical protein [Paraburkholderia sp. UCT31]
MVAAPLAAQAPAAYVFRVPFKGLQGASVAKTSTANGPTLIGDGVSTQGACAYGGITGCATFNPADADPAVTLSNGNLTESSSAGTPRSVRTTVSESSGKWYWEETSTGPNTYSGVGTSAEPLSDHPGFDNYGWGYMTYLGRFYHNGNGPNGTGGATGKSRRFMLDLDAGTLLVYEGNSKLFTTTGVTGAIFPIASGGTATHNYGQSAFAYPVPAGYHAGFW